MASRPPRQSSSLHRGRKRPACRAMTTVSTTVGLLVGVSRSVDALVMPTTGFIIPLSAGHHARPSVRPTRATGEIKCSATSQGGGEAESADSSEIYSALRNRLQVGREGISAGCTSDHVKFRRTLSGACSLFFK